MEDEAEKLMAENLSKNFIDYEEYPQTAEICVSIVYELSHKQTKEKKGGGRRTAESGGSQDGIIRERAEGREGEVYKYGLDSIYYASI